VTPLDARQESRPLGSSPEGGVLAFGKRRSVLTSAMSPSDVQPMTLGNMRANGVRSLLVYCFACHHEAVLRVEDYPDDVQVPTFGPRMVCSRVRHDRCRRTTELERTADN
jgi:hypothetical protein